MTMTGYYYIALSLTVAVLGAAVVARMTRTAPRAWRLIATITAAVFLLMLLVWIVQLNLGATE